jgi:hypothetical protein
MRTLLGMTLHFDDGTAQKVPVSALVGEGGGARANFVNADECPTHGPWRAVPPGVSKSTGRQYDAFWGCDQPKGEPRCVNKPSREWVETHPPGRALPAPVDDFSDLPF